MTTETIALRQATAADAAALAGLVAQLYHAEMPGVLRGPPQGQLRLFRYLVEHELAAGGRGRYLAVDAAGRPVGTASIRLDDAPPVIAPGLLGVAVRALGWPDALRFLLCSARAALLFEPPPRPREGFIYSVVVDAAHRRRGVAAQLMAHLEDVARRHGARTAALRVVVGNQPARRLYERLGYRLVSRTPRWADRVGIPSELMRKELSA